MIANKTVAEWEAMIKTELHDRGDEIDPESEYHWGTLTLGWLIANKFTPDEAHDFSRHIRYHTDLC
jgi:hypothetical protein